MQLESSSGNIRDVASWALQVKDARRLLFISGLQRPAEGLRDQTAAVLARMDEMLAEANMTRRNVVWWDCTLDPRVTDQEFNGVVMAMLTDYFKDNQPKPAAATVRFARVLGGRLVEIEFIAAE